MTGPHGWDLSVVFADDDAALAEAASLVVAADELVSVSSPFPSGADATPIVSRFAELDARVDQVYDYARMRQYADANGPGVQGLVVGVTAFVNAARAALERVLDAWRSVAPSAADEVLAVPGLEPARYRLAHARRLGVHRLSPAEERVWSARTETARVRWGSLNDNVEGALLVSFDDGGGERLWGVGDLGTLLRRPEPEVRRAAYEALADAYASINDVLAIAWDALVADRLVEDRLRGRAHPTQETLDTEDMGLDGLQALVDLAPERYDIRQRLLDAQARLLALDEFTAADADAPLPGMEPLDYETVTSAAVAGLAALAPTLGEDARALVERGRVDAETRAGKQPYAVTFSSLLDPPAFLSYRFTGGPGNVPLLGHELGHAVALARSSASQPFIAQGWPGVVFEVPSMTAEIAAGDALVDELPEHAQTIRFVAAQDLAWSAFETVAFCLVELDLYAARAGGEVLTAGIIQEAFQRRFAALYGPDVPFGARDALVAMGSWANYAMHSRFYSYQYAVGALVALALHARRRQDPEKFAADYVAFLSEGRSASPAAQLARFDLALDGATWAAGYDELERRFAVLA